MVDSAAQHESWERLHCMRTVSDKVWWCTRIIEFSESTTVHEWFLLFPNAVMRGKWLHVSANWSKQDT